MKIPEARWHDGGENVGGAGVRVDFRGRCRGISVDQTGRLVVQIG